jgi:hypothetical protein
MGRHDHGQDVAPALIGHVAQNIPEQRWPMAHANVHWDMGTPFVQEPLDRGGLLQGEFVKR